MRYSIPKALIQVYKEFDLLGEIEYFFFKLKYIKENRDIKRKIMSYKIFLFWMQNLLWNL